MRRNGVENKKIDPLFGITVIAFLLVTIVLIKDFNTRRVNDYKEYSADIASIVRLKNNKIKILAHLLAAKTKENADLRTTLSDTRNALDALSKKLVQPVAVSNPANPPAGPSTNK
jgi:regulatory protein YycI of two-component signal transduction system YycFG